MLMVGLLFLLLLLLGPGVFITVLKSLIRLLILWAIPLITNKIMLSHEKSGKFKRAVSACGHLTSRTLLLMKLIHIKADILSTLLAWDQVFFFYFRYFYRTRSSSFRLFIAHYPMDFPSFFKDFGLAFFTLNQIINVLEHLALFINR